MEINDPLSQFEEVYSNDDDDIEAKSLYTIFALDGNDTITSSIDSYLQFAIGGDGDDTYVLNKPGILIILDNANSDNDAIIAPNFEINSDSTYFGTIDGRHLVVGDVNIVQRLIIIDYQTSANKIESITATITSEIGSALG